MRAPEFLELRGSCVFGDPVFFFFRGEQVLGEDDSAGVHGSSVSEVLEPGGN